MHIYYVVVEITENEATSTLCTSLDEAYSTYFTIMANAYNSQDPYHGASIIQYTGSNQILLEGRALDRNLLNQMNASNGVEENSEDEEI